MIRNKILGYREKRRAVKIVMTKRDEDKLEEYLESVTCIGA